MRARSKSIARDILRVFEIALFFAISVLGYGLLAKTSTSSSKYKNRSQPSDVRKSLACGGDERELLELTKIIGIPSGKHLSPGSQDRIRVVPSPQEVMYAYHLPYHALLTRHEARLTSESLSYPSPVPFNLFQQNPVLLI
jgi:hypothetical protein